MENLQTAESNTTKKKRPALYVGTYAKYNNGSINGAWLYLEDYADAEEFLEACAALHSDECDPEYMFQDCEHLPEFLYGECADIDLIYEFLNLDSYERAIIEAYQNDIASEPADSWQSVIEAHFGIWNSKQEFAWHFVEEYDGYNDIPQHLRCFFDCDSYTEALFINSFVDAYDSAGNMHVFANR